VPLVTVMLAVFTAFPMFGKLQVALQKYFLQSLVPDGIARRCWVPDAVCRQGQPAGHAWACCCWLVTALALVLTIDRTLNGIWRVRRPRRWRSGCWCTGRR
jgi:membrane protein